MSIESVSNKGGEKMEEKVKINAFNDGNVSVEMLKLTPFIEENLNMVCKEDSELLKKFLCVYAYKDGSFEKDEGEWREDSPILSRKPGKDLLPVLINSINTLNLKKLTAFKKPFLEILPSLVLDLRQTIATAREIPRLIEIAETQKGGMLLLKILNLLVTPYKLDDNSELRQFPHLGEKIVDYIEAFAKSPNEEGVAQLLELLSDDLSNDRNKRIEIIKEGWKVLQKQER